MANRNKYDRDFKLMIVGLLETGRPVKEISNEYTLNDGMIRRWKREFNKSDGTIQSSNALSEEAKRVKALEKELKEMTLERDILKKAVSIFSKSDR